MLDIKPISCALVSVSDKTGLDSLAQFFKEQHIKVISTGKTAQILEQHGLIVTDCAAVGRMPEMLGGRVKTLNHRIHAAILCDRSKSHHVAEIKNLDIEPIDMVITNLYPFESLVGTPDATLESLIEEIDIGGVTLLRAAAKNCQHLVALNHPSQYQDFIHHYQSHKGTTLTFRHRCAVQVFTHTYRYDQVIADELAKRLLDENEHTSITNKTIVLSPPKQLRYGENPHQTASLYSFDKKDLEISLATCTSLNGKEISYNNILDIHKGIWALRCLSDEQEHNYHYAVIVKHGIPCGAACSENASIALQKAIASDPESAFGGIAIMSTVCNAEAAQIFSQGFYEVIVAPDFTSEALTILQQHKNLRLVPIKNLNTAKLDQKNIRSIWGGMMIQDQDTTSISSNKWQIATTKKPSTYDLKAMEFAFRLVKAAPSNAIAIADPNQLWGIGAGQPNRLLATEIALSGAISRGFELKNAALASDGFFPFADCIKKAHEFGIGLIIQPGGSIRDPEIIKEADKLGLCMVFTHQRHFLH